MLILSRFPDFPYVTRQMTIKPVSWACSPIAIRPHIGCFPTCFPFKRSKLFGTITRLIGHFSLYGSRISMLLGLPCAERMSEAVGRNLMKRLLAGLLVLLHKPLDINWPLPSAVHSSLGAVNWYG